MRLPRKLFFLAFPALLVACAGPVPSTPRLVVTAWELPPAKAAAQPDLSPAPDGTLLLSWVEGSHAAQQLSSARFGHGRWQATQRIARGDYFGSSADAPHVRATPDGAVWAQWLRKTPAGGHALDVVLARSGDGGATWAEPVLVNLDGTPTEHGFGAMWPASAGGIGLAWLDGRATGGEHGSGATMVRASRFSASLQRSDEIAVDARSCDCCQMDAATTRRGQVLVYRDRSPGDVRDIAIARLEGGKWDTPRIVYADGWVMKACPINGPAVATHEGTVAVAWYTGAGGQGSVRLALSRDDGANFENATTLSRGPGVIGNVDVALDAAAAWVLWRTESAAGGLLQLARVPLDGGPSQRIELARLKARGRGAGVPKLVASGGSVYAVWTDLADGIPSLRGAQVALR